MATDADTILDDITDAADDPIRVETDAGVVEMPTLEDRLKVHAAKKAKEVANAGKSPFTMQRWKPGSTIY